MCPSDDISLPNDTLGLSVVRISVISKVSSPSTSSSQVTDTLALPSLAPASIVMLNESELKSSPDPIRKEWSFVD